MTGVDGLGSFVPDGSLAPDEEVIARLADDMYRSAFRMMAPEAAGLTRDAAPAPAAAPPSTAMPAGATARPATTSYAAPGSEPSREFLAGLRQGFDTGALAGRADRAFRVTPAAIPSPGEYYWLRELDAGMPSRLPRRAETPHAYDAATVRRDFPALAQDVHGRPLIWLDNAATTHKPQSVIDSLAAFYEHDNSNIHRGAHALAARATDAYEAARETVRRFIGAPSTSEIIFVRGTTEAINLVAQSFGGAELGPGDEVLLTTLEHHSNIVPWQLVCLEKGARLRVVPLTDRGEVMVEEYERLLGPRTRIVAVSQVSNALGTIVPVREMTQLAHAHGAVVVVDGAQAVPHMPVDVSEIGCDFYAFSGHKLFGPSGVGVLWGRESLLDAMPPWQGGGSMIKTVTFERSTFNDLPYKFEAGTPVIAGAIGLAAAIDYVTALGLDNIALHEHALLEYGTAALGAIPGVRLIGTAPEKAAVISFVLDGMEVEDVGRLLDRAGVAVRAGHHCAQPSLRHFGLESTVRPSLALYNTFDDMDVLVGAISAAARAAGHRV